MKQIILTLTLAVSLSISAQNVGIGTSTPAAKLDISSTNSGILIPRVGLTGSNDMVTVPSPVTSTLIYNTATVGGANAVTPGFYYWSGSQWLRVIDNSSMQNIYSTNGTLAGTRTMTMGNDSIIFNSTNGNFIYQTTGTGTISMGNGNTASGNNSVAIGLSNTASAANSVAIGGGTATGPGCIAMGQGSTASDQTSVALGAGSVAYGVSCFGAVGGNATVINSIALGSGSVASQTNALAMMGGNASQPDAVAIGPTAVASNSSSIAMGFRTNSSGQYAIALGHNVNALSGIETVLGTYNTAYTPSSTTQYVATDRLFTIGNGQSAALTSDAMVILKNGYTGIGTSTPAAQLHVVGNTGILATGTLGATLSVSASGAGTRMMWIPGQAAFRVGNVTGTAWDSVNIGQYSVAMGLDAKASGSNSIALGNNTSATNQYSVALGQYANATGLSSVGIGVVTAIGEASYAIGSADSTVGGNSFAIGNFITTRGLSSLALGNYLTAPSYQETAMGMYNTTYTPLSVGTLNASDRLFTIGNGTSSGARSDAMVILKNGNTGIGNSTPGSLLFVGSGTTAGGTMTGLNVAAGTNSYISTSDGTKTVFMGADFNSYGIIGTLTNHDLVVRTNNAEKMRITAAGRVGIGTTAPGAPLHIGTGISTGITTASLSREYFSSGSGTAGFTAGTSASGNIMVQADGWYWANGGGYVATSDERIKNILGISDNKQDLSILSQIKVTDYEYKDEIVNGSGKHKKVIAQQLNEVYPQAVKTNNTPQFIPNIYQMAGDYSATGNLITIDLADDVCDARDIKPGGNCKFYLYAKADSAQHEMKGTVVSLSGKKLVIAVEEKPEAGKYDKRIFVYGTEINDLLSVDYEAISMLNVSATQELAKQLAEEKKKNEILQQLILTLQDHDKATQSDLDKLKASLEMLEEKMGTKAER